MGSCVLSPPPRPAGRSRRLREICGAYIRSLTNCRAFQVRFHSAPLCRLIKPDGSVNAATFTDLRAAKRALAYLTAHLPPRAQRTPLDVYRAVLAGGRAGVIRRSHRRERLPLWVHRTTDGRYFAVVNRNGERREFAAHSDPVSAHLEAWRALGGAAEA